MLAVGCLLSLAMDYGPLTTDFPFLGVNTTNTNNVRQKR